MPEKGNSELPKRSSDDHAPAMVVREALRQVTRESTSTGLHTQLRTHETTATPFAQSQQQVNLRPRPTSELLRRTMSGEYDVR
jgi:hypothetical protein